MLNSACALRVFLFPDMLHYSPTVIAYISKYVFRFQFDGKKNEKTKLRTQCVIYPLHLLRNLTKVE